MALEQTLFRIISILMEFVLRITTTNHNKTQNIVFISWSVFSRMIDSLKQIYRIYQMFDVNGQWSFSHSKAYLLSFMNFQVSYQSVLEYFVRWSGFQKSLNHSIGMVLITATLPNSSASAKKLTEQCRLNGREIERRKI